MTAPVAAATYPIGNDSILQPLPGCKRSHWDATAIYRLTTPQGATQQLPMDPRPWTKVCLNYVNSGPAEPAPAPPADTVFPMGGGFYPPTRYSQAIDVESKLQRLDRPLGTDRLRGSCEPNQYEVPLNSDTFIPGKLLPLQDRRMKDIFYETKLGMDIIDLPAKGSVVPEKDSYLESVVDQVMSGLQNPFLRNVGQNECSPAVQRCNLQANGKQWNNVTKMQKYTQYEPPCGSIYGYVNGKNPSTENLPTV